MNVMKISDDVTVGPQPSEADLAKLPADGFRAVVNFRADGEEDQPLPPSAEGDQVRASGLEYLHLPVSTESLGPELVDRFRARYADLPKPVYAHCKSGKRAGAMVMMHAAVERGLSGEETLKQAERMGFECDQPELKNFVRSYVDARTEKEGE